MRDRDARRQAEWDASPACADWVAREQERETRKTRGDAEGLRRYSRAHRAVFDARGHASDYLCFCGCGGRANEWAFQHGRRESGRWGTSPFGPPVSYEPMAIACHRAYDREYREEMGNGQDSA